MAPPEHAACPSVETLAAAADGRLTTAAEAAVAAHLDYCRRCRDRLDALASLQEFAAAVGPAGHQPFAPSAALDTAVDVLKAEGPTSAGGGQPVDGSTCPYADLLPWLEPASPGIGRVGGYLITRFLGRGGMGVVFAGREQSLDRPVAIKFLPPTHAADATHRERFLAEARATATINHPNVITILAVTETDGLPLLVMERFDGEPLSDLLRRCKPLDIPTVLSIGQKVAAGLQAAHAQGLLHRDLKPGNLLVSPDLATVKLVDFGLACHQGETTPPLAGTPGFIAPEVIAGDKPDVRSDLYSLGCTLQEMLSGQKPPRWFANLIEQLLAASPAARPQSAAEVEMLLTCGPVPLKETGESASAMRAASRILQGAGLAGGMLIAVLLAWLVPWPPFPEDATGISVDGIAFADLTEAIEASSSGSTIFLEEAETFELDSIDLGDRDITIEAHGPRPLLRFHSEGSRIRESLFRVAGQLRLVGVDLELVEDGELLTGLQAEHSRCLIDIDEGDLRLEDCGLVVEGDACCILATACNQLELIDCHLHAPAGVAVDWKPAPGGAAVAEATVMTGGTAWAIADPISGTLRLSQVTTVTDRLISVRSDAIEDLSEGSLLIEAEACVVAAEQAVLMVHADAMPRQAFSESLSWRGNGNLIEGPLIIIDQDSGPTRPEWLSSDEEWPELGSFSGKDSLMQPITFVRDRAMLRYWPTETEDDIVEATTLVSSEWLREHFGNKPPGAAGAW